MADEVQEYVEFLRDIQSRCDRINQRMLAAPEQRDVWAQASAWGDVLPGLEDLYAVMTNTTPPLQLASEHVSLVSIVRSIVAAIKFGLSSADAESRRVNELLFEAAGTKAESEWSKFKSLVQEVMQKTRNAS